MTISQSFVVELHTQLIQRFGGETGIRDHQILDSCIQSIYQTFDQKELYPSVIEKATRLAFNLITSHPFIDGNKRIGMHMLIFYLKYENLAFNPAVEEIIKVGFSIAKGKLTYDKLIIWVKLQISK
jgi:death on curing protein